MLPPPGAGAWAGLWIGEMDRLVAWRSSLEFLSSCPDLAFTPFYIKNCMWHSGRYFGWMRETEGR